MVASISTALSPAQAWSIWGAQMEVGTVASIFIFVLVIALASLVPRAYIKICSIALASILIATLGLGWFVSKDKVEIRPSLTATMVVTAPLYLESLPHALVGEGPHLFDMVWQRYRPIEVNSVPWWDASFFYGYSTLTTFAATIGVLGILTVLLAFTPAVMLGYRAVRARSFSIAEILCIGMAVVVFGFLCFTIVSPWMWYVGAAALGLGARLAGESSYTLRRWWLALGLLMVTGVFAGGGWIFVRQTQASSTHTQGVAAFEAQAFEGSQTLVTAAKLWEVSEYDRDASRAILQAAFTTYQTQGDESALKFQITNAIQYADRAVGVNPSEYASHISRASLFIALASVNYPQADFEATSSLAKAEKLSPLRPEVSYLRGVLARQQGDTSAARNFAKAALQLKSDYTQAEDLLKALQ